MTAFVLLAGSPLPGTTNSDAIAAWLHGQLTALGATARVTSLRALERDPAAHASVLDDLDAEATLVPISPVFLDTPPAQLLAWMARICDDRRDRGATGGRLLPFCHSGYLEDTHREASIRIWTHFAADARLQLIDAVGFGGTSPIGGRPLDEGGFLTSRLRDALGLLARDLATTGALSPACHRRFARGPLPLPDALLPPLLNGMIRKGLTISVAAFRARPYGE